MPDTNFSNLAATVEQKQPKKTLPQKASGLVESFFDPISKPLGAAFGEIGGAAARTLAPKYEQQWKVGAQQAGEALPRTAAEAFLTSKGVPGKVVGLGDVALRTFAEQPPEQSLGQRLGTTAVQTAAFEAAPRVGGAVGGVAKRAIPDARPMLKLAAERGASTLGTLGAFEAANLASSEIQGVPYNPITPEHIAGTAASIIPFEAAGLYGQYKEHGFDPRKMWFNTMLDKVYKEEAAKRVVDTRQREEPTVAPATGVKPMYYDTKKGEYVPGKYPYGHWVSPEGVMHPVDDEEAHGLYAHDLIEKHYPELINSGDKVYELKKKGWQRAIVEEKYNNFFIDGPLTHNQKNAIVMYGIENELKVHEVNAQGRPKVLYEPPDFGGVSQMHADDKEHLSNLEKNGLDAGELAKVAENLRKTRDLPSDLEGVEAKDLEGLRRKPNESLDAYWLRRSGVDLKSEADPDLLMKSAKDYATWMMRDVMGRSDDYINFWVPRYLRHVAMVGAGQGQTRIVASPEEGSWYAPKTKDLPNAILGVLTKKELGITGEMYMAFHSTAHEFFHGKLEGKDPATQALWQQVNDMNLSQTEMEQSIKSLLTSMGRDNLLDYRSKYYSPDADGRTEYLADAFGAVSMGAISSRQSKAFKMVDDLLRFTNDDFRNVVKSFIKDMLLTWDALKELPRMVGYTPKVNVNQIVEGLQKLMKTAEEAEITVQAFLRHNEIRNARPWAPVPQISYDEINKWWTQLGEEGYDKDLKRMIQDGSTEVVPQEMLGMSKRAVKQLPLHVKWWEKVFLAMPQFIRSYPDMADMARLGRYENGRVKAIVKDMAKELANFETGKYDDAGVRRVINPSEKVNKVASIVMLKHGTIYGDEEGRRLTPEEMNEIPEYAKLSPEDKRFVDDKIDQFSSANMVGAFKNIESLEKQHALGASYALMSHDPTLSWDKAYELGLAMVARHLDADRLGVDPSIAPDLHMKVAAAEQRIQQYLTDPKHGRLNAEAFEQVEGRLFKEDNEGKELVAGKVSPVVANYRAARERFLGKWLPPDKDTETWHFQSRPGYFSEVRPGRYLIMWKKKGEEPQLVGVKNKKDYEKRVLPMIEEFNKDSGKPDLAREWEYLRYVDRENERDKFQGMRPDLFKAYNDAINALNNRVLAAINSEHPEAEGLLNQIREELKPGEEMAKLMSAPWMRERKLYGGRDELNMPEGQIHYINSIAHTVTRRELTGQQRLFLNDPKMRAQPELQALAKKYFSEIMDPTEKGYGLVKAFIFMNYCLFSPSLAYVELTQQLTNHAPALMSQGAGVGEAYGSIKQANVDFFKALKRGNAEKKDFNVYDNPEETEDVARLMQMMGSGGWLQEFIHLEEDMPIFNTQNLLSGSGSVFDREGLIGKPIYHMYRMGVKAHAYAIDLNQEVAALSSYRLFRKTMSREDAVKATDDLVHESMHGGGRASRPFWFLGIGGKGTPGPTVGGLMYSLQMYAYNTIGQQARYLRRSIDNTKLKPDEVAGARRAAATALGTQVVLAGLMGLPFSSQIFALIEQFFPNSEPKRKAREAVFTFGKDLNKKTHLFGQDEEAGHFLSDAAIDGIVNSIPGGINIGNRFELGGLMGVSPYGGFDWKNMLGPGGDLFQRLLVKAPQKLGEGDAWGAARELIPNNQIRRIAQLATDGFNIRNKDERLNVELTDAEKALQIAGFTPKRVADFRQLNEMKRRADKVQSAEQKRFHEEMAAELIHGNPQKVTAALWQRARTLQNYDPREGARRIAQLVQERTEQFDPMRTGSKIGSTYNVGRLYPRPENVIPETQLLQHRVALTQQLGFPMRLTKTELREAQLVDQLLQSNPLMSRQEAKALLERTLHPGRMQYFGGEGVQGQ